MVWGSGVRVQGSGFGVWDLGFRVQGSGFRVQGLGFRVWGAGCIKDRSWPGWVKALSHVPPPYVIIVILPIQFTIPAGRDSNSPYSIYYSNYLYAIYYPCGKVARTGAGPAG